MEDNEVMLNEATTPADDWDDIDLSDLVDTPDAPEEEAKAEEPTDQPEETAEKSNETEKTESAEEKPEEKPAEEETAPADQPEESFELNHLGNKTSVNREEVIRLAQQGMDYQRIREERDTAKGEVKRLTEYEEFLKELAGEGQTIPQLIDNTRASILAKKEGIDPTVALQRVQLARERKEFEASKAAANESKAAAEKAEAEKQQNIMRFVKAYPDVDPKTIPQSVWNEAFKGEDLTSAYTKYENGKLREQIKDLNTKLETQKKNVENAARSTGSQKSAGQGKQPDAWDAAWYDGN